MLNQNLNEISAALKRKNPFKFLDNHESKARRALFGFLRAHNPVREYLQFREYLQSFECDSVAQAFTTAWADVQGRRVKESEFNAFVDAAKKALLRLEHQRKIHRDAEPIVDPVKKASGESRISTRRREAFRLVQETGSYDEAYLVDLPHLGRMTPQNQVRAKAAFRRAYRRFRHVEK